MLGPNRSCFRKAQLLNRASEEPKSNASGARNDETIRSQWGMVEILNKVHYRKNSWQPSDSLWQYEKETVEGKVFLSRKKQRSSGLYLGAGVATNMPDNHRGNVWDLRGRCVPIPHLKRCPDRISGPIQTEPATRGSSIAGLLQNNSSVTYHRDCE